jgi:hypothetical protein
MSDAESTVRALGTLQLLRLMLNRLWQRYDVGGISYGRRLRAGLVEAIFKLIEPGKNDYELEDEKIHNIAREREPLNLGNQGVLDLGLGGLSSIHLIMFLLRELESWYVLDSAESEFPLVIEHRFVTEMCRLAGVARNLDQFDRQSRRYSPLELIGEADERSRVQHLFELGSRP